MKVYFVSDLHGKPERYRKLAVKIADEPPDAVLVGGDLLPNYFVMEPAEFAENFLLPLLTYLKSNLRERFPSIYYIFGNDDPASALLFFDETPIAGLMKNINMQVIKFSGIQIGGYAYIPPTPFLLKDWEKYDVSRYIPRGALSPEEGIRTVATPANIVRYTTIADDLEILNNEVESMSTSIFLFHAPPCDTNLDKILSKDINGNTQVTRVGSVAIRKFIEKHKPAVTLHGHIHESAAISGSWKDKIGETFCFSAGHDGEELALVSFDTENPSAAMRLLL